MSICRIACKERVLFHNTALDDGTLELEGATGAEVVVGHGGVPEIGNTCTGSPS